VQVAAFIGIDIGASTGVQIENGPTFLTPWGYLAWQIGGNDAYAWLKQKTSAYCSWQRCLRKVFGDRSMLLLDEFLVYVENAMGLVVGTQPLVAKC